jgi:iron complex outermembrane recepter protein
MNFQKTPIAFAISAMLFACVAPQATFAQTPPPTQTEAQKAEEARKAEEAKKAEDAKKGSVQKIEGIVVTASGRSQSAVTVPYNVTAISEEALRESNITDIKKLIADNTSINAPGNSARFADSVTVRGLNISPVNANNLEQFVRTTIAYYLDDTPLPNIGYRIKDVNRVETLLGPQGTLYGAGSLGGTIRYITNDPKLGKTEAKINTSFYATKGGGVSNDTDLVFNLPLGENVALRASVAKLDEKGYTDRVSNPPWRLGTFAWVTKPDATQNVYKDDDYQKVTGGRLSLLWKVMPDVQLKFAHAEQDQFAHGTSATSLLPLRIANAQTPAEVLAAWRAGSGSFTNACVATNSCRYSNANIFDTPFAVDGQSVLSRYPEFARRKFQLDSVDLDWDLGFARLHSSASQFEDRRQGEADYASQGEIFYFRLGDAGARIDSGRSAFITFNNTYKGSSYETRLTSKGDGPLQWIAGLYYTKQDRSLRFSEFLPGIDTYVGIPRTASGSNGNVDEGYRENLASVYREKAIYGEVGYKITPAWLATVGGRAFNYDDTSTANIRDYSFDLVNNNVTKTSGENGNSYFKFNTSYQFNRDLLAYYTFSQGFRRGGTNPFRDVGTLRVSADNRTYAPDSTDNNEIGLKGYLFNRQVYLQTDVFQIDWKNPQTYRSQDIEGFPVNGTANGANARTRGWEMAARVNVAQNFQFTLKSTYTTGEFVDTKTNCLYENSTTNCRTWAKGGVLGGGPRWKHNASARYNMYLDNGTYLWASLSGRYVSEVPVDRSDSSADIIRKRPGYSLYNFNAGATYGDWDVSVWVQNLSNKRAEVSGQGSTTDIMGPRVIYATPRTIGTNISYNFK